ncbi:mannose-1-phosphate guanylyltransferase [uncultured Paludibaculum sp.]|uniref:mannose-1-phosphate guanylyltransferase n=1 Tax=uncultured Paludibaculum sp. TaxID=1765020 RepID=UPI002AAB1983|nr:mannose-1-phosphate guanylyltransferase [uncultured Paludibaculum sp.]
MRYAMILAGGSGVRLWPMSRARQPKQLIPFLGGRSLLQVAADRLEGLVPAANRYICAAEKQRALILAGLPGWSSEQFLGEPMGRDTLNAVGFSAAVIAQSDPNAVIAVFTADHLIEPQDEFRRIVGEAFDLVESNPNTLATFGIAPVNAATGYGYLQLGEPLSGSARRVVRFQEKPDLETARNFLAAGPERYLWNSGMFVWRADTLLDCIRRYEPTIHAALMEIAAAWNGPGRLETLDRLYPQLKKISIDYAVMEPASRDDSMQVAAVPMPLQWLDVGSWPSFAETCERDDHGNALAAKSITLDASGNLLASSDPGHLLAAVGCEDLIVIHTPDATMVCRKDRAEDIKKLHALLGERFGAEYL